MSKLFDVVKTEFKLLFRNKIIWLVLPLTLLYSGYGFYFFNVMEEDQGQSLMSSSFVVQAGLFAFMVFGYYLISIEKVNQCDELFFCLPKVEIYKIAGKFIVSIILVTGFVLVNNIVLFLFYYLGNISEKLYIDSIKYFVLYWEFGFVTSVLIGMNIGIFIKSRAAYITMFIFWLFIGPLNYYIFRPLSTLLRLDLRVPQYILNLGQHDPHSAYNVLYGFPLQSFNYTQRLLILLLLLTLFILLYWRKEKKVVITALTVFLIVFIPVFNKYRLNFGMIKSYVSYTHQEEYDLKYYMEHGKDEIIKNEAEFRIKSCDINLKIDNELKMNVRAKVLLNSPGDKLLFTLYRNFNIKSIRDEKGKALKFNRKGDSIEVLFNEVLNKGEEKVINFDYEGYSSPLFFADENAVMLPAYFPYIPSSLNAPAMAVNNTGFYRNDFSFTSDYTLTFEGKHKLYTSLNKIGENKWEGKNAAGITIAAGNICEKLYDGITYYYPAISSNKFSNFIKDISSYKAAADNVNNKFGDSLQTDIKKAFFIPIPSESNETATSLWSFDDSLLVQNDISNHGRFSGKESEALIPVLSLGLRDKIRKEDKDEPESLFLRVCSIVYCTEKDRIPEYLSMEAKQYRKLSDEVKKHNGNNSYKQKAEIFEKMESIYNKDNNKLDRLLVKLYGRMKNQDMTFDEINLFIDEGEWVNE